MIQQLEDLYPLVEFIPNIPKLKPHMPCHGFISNQWVSMVLNGYYWVLSGIDGYLVITIVYNIDIILLSG